MTKPAPMTYQAPNGAVWTFDPDSQKWSVTLGDQKSSSQKYDTLMTKVDKWVHAAKTAAQASEAAAPAKPAPAAPSVFSFGMARSLIYNVSSDPDLLLTTPIPPREKDGVTVKTSWNADQERFDIVRYRGWSSRPSREVPGWESSQANQQYVVNFEALDEDEQAWWRTLFAHRAQVALAAQARRTISAAWVALKQDVSAFHTTTSPRQREQTGELLAQVPRSSVTDSTRAWMTMQGCPVSHVQTLAGTDGWSNDQGLWTRSTGTGTLRLGFKTEHSAYPTFTLTHELPDGTVQPLWSGSSFSLAMALSNASVVALGTSSTVQAGWEVDMGFGYEEKQLKNHVFGLGRFPTHVEAQAAVFQQADDSRNSDMWVLGRSYDRSRTDPFREQEDGLSSQRRQMEEIRWRSKRQGGRNTFLLSKGPEDVLLDVMADLDTLTREAVRGFVDELSREGLIQRLHRQTQATLKHAYDLAGDGETLSEDPTYMVNRWQDTVVREEARAAQHPSVIAFKAQRDALIERAALLLADLGHTVDLKAKATVKATGAQR